MARITAGEFHAAAGVEDWRVLLGSAQTVFRTGSFARGAALVAAIGALAEEAGHHPDVDLRYPTVAVRTTTHDEGGLTEKDVALARAVSLAARELGVVADPLSAQEVEVAVDVLVGAAVQPFWRAVLGYQEVDPSGGAASPLVDRLGHGPSFWFQQMDAPRTQRGRIHVDVTVPHDVAQERVAATLAAGGRLVTDRFAPAWWVLADAEGNEACVCTWQDRGQE